MFRLHPDWEEEEQSDVILKKVLQRIVKEHPQKYKKMSESDEIFVVNIDHEYGVMVFKEGDYFSEINQRSLIDLVSDFWKWANV